MFSTIWKSLLYINHNETQIVNSTQLFFCLIQASIA
jgi:hypothetical protein